MNNYQIIHLLSSNHRRFLDGSEICGCFYCCKIFKPSEIKDWVDGGQTAICPSCGVDAILPQVAEFTLDSNLLTEMYEYWFAPEIL